MTKGWFTFLYDMPSRGDLTVQLIDSQGRLIDELRVDAEAKGVTFTTRLERVADRLGSAVARYLRKRQHE